MWIVVGDQNPFAFELMNRVKGLEHRFISVIQLSPFDSLDLQEMIIRRHRSSGLKFILKNKEEEAMSEFRLARLFNQYFDYSEGNPGVALQAWLSNIIKVSGDKIHIRLPNVPDASILEELEEDWKVLLVQVILNKRLTMEKIERIFMDDKDRANESVRSLVRSGLITERLDNLYVVNSYIEPYIVNNFKREGLL